MMEPKLTNSNPKRPDCKHIWPGDLTVLEQANTFLHLREGSVMDYVENYSTATMKIKSSVNVLLLPFRKC